MADPPILVITDRRQCPESLETRVAALLRGGCRFLSLREKDLPPADRLALLHRIVALARPFGAAVCIHDDIAAARACGAGLHLPADGDAGQARRALGTDRLIGQSCHTGDEIRAASASGMDYVTMGPAFPTASKPGYRPVVGLATAVAGHTLPILALGGITPDRVCLLPAGISGVAVMGGAMTARDPERWFSEIRAAWAARISASVRMPA